MGDSVEIVEEYRGVGIQADQPRERIEKVVKPGIEEVQKITDLHALFAYASEIVNPPEARLLAAEMCNVIFDLAVSERRVRPDIDLDLLKARVAGLDSKSWRSPWRYCALGEPDHDRAMPREEALE